MSKVKVPFKRFPLPRQRGQEWVPPKDKQEGTDIRNRGYHPGANYTPDEFEFIRAVEAFQKKTGRKFLSHVDYQRLAISLGYRRHAPTPARATPMTADTILSRMVALGFVFSRAADGSVSFRPPADCSSVERQHLLAVVAWSWHWLSEYAGPFITPPEVRP